MRQTKITRLAYNEDIVNTHLNIYKKLNLNNNFQFAIKKIRTEFNIKEFSTLTSKELDKFFKNPNLIKKSITIRKIFLAR